MPVILLPSFFDDKNNIDVVYDWIDELPPYSDEIEAGEPDWFDEYYKVIDKVEALGEHRVAEWMRKYHGE